MADIRAKVNEQSVRMTEAYNKRDFRGFADLFAEECHVFPPGFDDSSTRDGIVMAMEGHQEKGVCILELEVKEVIGEDGDPFIVWRNIYRLRDAKGQLLATGRGIMVNKKVGEEYKGYINIWNIGRKD